MSSEKTLLASLQIERIDGGFLASIPGIQGAFAEGDTIEEALFNCVDIAKLIFQYRKERDESLGFNFVNFKKNTSITFSFPIGIS